MKNRSIEIDKVFTGQRDNERFLFMFRRHIIAVRKGFLGLLAIVTIASLPAFIAKDSSVAWLIFAGLILGLLFFLHHFVTWYFSIYIVSDQRIRQITQKGFFAKSIIDLPLDKVESVSCIIPGVSAGILGFGTINVQTSVGDLIINNVEKPNYFYDKLQDALKYSQPERSTND